MVQQIEELKDDDLPRNTLEWFTELPEVQEMIRNLVNIYKSSFEKAYETYSAILSRYQEQPHLLDPHLGDLVTELLRYIRENTDQELQHCTFKYLYQLSKVRTYKAFVKFLPHEISDLDVVLELLERQDTGNVENWESRYVLLLWLSILVLNPFHMSRLDAYSPEGGPTSGQRGSKMERIYRLCQVNCDSNDSCSEVAAFLSAKYLIRSDVKDSLLPKFIDWIIEGSQKDEEAIKIGQLRAISAILKHGKREDILPHTNRILQWVTGCNFKDSNDYLKHLYHVKIVKRLGLVFLKPQLARWRYQRGSRSIVANLERPAGQENTPVVDSFSGGDVQQPHEEIVVPDEIEDIIEELLQALRSSSSEVRWSAAKGIGRVTNRLPKSLGDEVVGTLIEVFNPLEPHEAWHGAALAMAELAKHGLLLLHRLSTMVPILIQALMYDEMKGYMSVGQHIRDAACYMSWAFARAYNPEDLQPFVQKIASALLVTTSFDREINCRRAASAAFQESVGRLGNFPHGIDILTRADFFSVGIRNNSYLVVSDYIAQFEEYTKPLIDHLIDRKVNHWDQAIRELTAKTLNKLTKHNPPYMRDEIIPKLFDLTDSMDVSTRHGSVLALGEIILALRTINPDLVTKEIVEKANGLIEKFTNREQFRGMSGEIMKPACTDFIRNCSHARIPATVGCLSTWQGIIDRCLTNKNAQIRESAIAALKPLCETYYAVPGREDANTGIIGSYLKGAENDLEENIRMGFLAALGALPKFMYMQNFEEILGVLLKQCLVPPTTGTTENPITAKWSEARCESVKALTNMTQTVGFEGEKSFGNPQILQRVFNCLLLALEEYTLDNRGDIGAWVREASMNGLFTVVTTCPQDILQPSVVHSIMTEFAQKAVEKIDRTRGLAGKLFCNLIHHNPSIPHIQEHERLKEIFPEDSNSVLWLFADHTFPLFCEMLAFPVYSPKILLGLSASIGQLSESLIKYSSASFFQFLKSHPDHVKRIGEEILMVFQENIHNERITCPLLNFLDLLIGSGTIDCLLIDPESTFPDRVFQQVSNEIAGQKKIYKLASSINVYCQLIQVPRLCPKILSKLMVFLGRPVVHVRKTAAIKLYEALIVHGDTAGIAEENMDEVLNLLSETNWGQDIAEIRPIRNELCRLCNVKPPVSVTKN
ncbi:tubulin-specific chaperone D [Lutzomyia longipalpis]|uniref:tubulin-specific chaperone D n=1 Tax=Lutzomyia longipalpis TaxID=7200 RepID=UPI0024842637|nr:tubulin-specific chaperone D [Lutzomyia longipalpis]